MDEWTHTEMIGAVCANDYKIDANKEVVAVDLSNYHAPLLQVLML